MATFLLSVGGSTIVPGGVPNIAFLKAFRKLILDRTKRGDRFVIVCGGGGTCRTYNDGLRQIIKPTSDDLDWLGIYTTHLNANLVRLMFGKLAHPELVNDYRLFDAKKWKQPLVIGGGFKPGGSTDMNTTLMAKKAGAKMIINISNVDYLYTKDPRKFKDAEKICEISWKAYRKMMGSKWTPGMNTPFDPIASKLADQANIDVLLVGPDTKNLANVLSEKAFKGTVIHR